MPIDEFIITVFCLVVDMLDEILKEQKLRRRGPAPKLYDAYVITMEIVGEFLGLDTDKGIHQYFKTHWQHFFPNIGDRTAFVRQAASLWNIKQIIREHLVEILSDEASVTRIIDGFPIPICNFKRAHFSKIFRGLAGFGHCAAKNQTYYGFRGHLLINTEGTIIDLTVAAANVDEREAIFEMSSSIPKDLLGDKGYICNEVRKEELLNEGINLQTPLRANMKDNRDPLEVKEMNRTRRLIETVIGQLSERFNIEKVRARDQWHLTVRIGRKILAHTIAKFLNKTMGNNHLQFDGLVTT
jgi:hypothetical protein